MHSVVLLFSVIRLSLVYNKLKLLVVNFSQRRQQLGGDVFSVLHERKGTQPSVDKTPEKVQPAHDGR